MSCERPTPEQDCSASVRLAVTAAVVVLAAVAFVPPMLVGGVSLRRANILSDLIAFDDSAPAASEWEADETFFAAGWTDSSAGIQTEAAAEEAAAEATREPDEAPDEEPALPATFEWFVGEEEPSAGDALPAVRRRGAEAIPPRIHAATVPVEDFDTTGRSPLAAFCRKLLAGREPVRIAFLGDSFIEGDILTADLRLRLQEAYGGVGFGFAPTASPLTRYRRTVKTQSDGWTAYNIMQYDRTPAALRDLYSVSGWVCQPAEGASTRWERPDEGAEACTEVRLLFISRSDSRVEVTLDDGTSRTFEVAGDDAVRQIRVVAPRGVRALAMRVAAGHEGFVGYGALFGSAGSGVALDNYSIRSNNGQAMFRSSQTVNAQTDALLGGYDLVVLQYGLNLMQQGVTGYRSYGAQLDRMIAYVRSCFPRAAVLVMGVSERSVREGSGFVPMDAVPAMTAAQRAAAERAGAAFWPTAEAMQALGGMAQFVQNGWAGKDYTHINSAGGRRVAEMLFDALNGWMEQHDLGPEAEAAAGLVDSLQRQRVESRLFEHPAIRPRSDTLPAAPDAAARAAEAAPQPFGASAAAAEPLTDTIPAPMADSLAAASASDMPLTER